MKNKVIYVLQFTSDDGATFKVATSYGFFYNLDKANKTAKKFNEQIPNELSRYQVKPIAQSFEEE